MDLTKTFRQFTKDYCEHYDMKHCRVEDITELQEDCFYIYGSDDVDWDFDKQVVTIYNVPRDVVNFDKFVQDYKSKHPNYNFTFPCSYEQLESAIDETYENSDYSVNAEELLIYFY